MLHELPLEVLILIIIMILGLSIFIKKLAMPEQYYKNREVFSQKLRERINITPDYFNVIKETEPGDIIEETSEDTEGATKPEGR